MLYFQKALNLWRGISDSPIISLVSYDRTYKHPNGVYNYLYIGRYNYRVCKKNGISDVMRKFFIILLLWVLGLKTLKYVQKRNPRNPRKSVEF